MLVIANDGNFGNFQITGLPITRFEALLAVPLACSASPLKWSQPEQTGTVDVVVLKELKVILFRVPVLSALFDGRL